MKNCIVAQSGGPTVAINASLAGIISEAHESREFNTVYGSVNGILGILNENLINLTNIIKDNPENIQTLKSSPAMYLGSCRYKLPAYTEDNSIYETIFQAFEKLNIGAFFYIGGNDSMDTVDKLSQYAKVIKSDVKILGIPKTIDNDLCETDHTPGFGSAAKYVATSVLEIAHDAYIYNTKSVTIVEIMGRNAGWLTAAGALARNQYSSAPHLIYLPEVPFCPEKFISDVKEKFEETSNVIVAVSEGIKDKEGNYLSAAESKDIFGHDKLSGTGKYLEYLVQEKLNVKVRSIELNVLQRCSSHLASLTDINEAFSLGSHAVQFALQGFSGVMLVMKREEGENYTVTYTTADVSEIANKEKCVPKEWITENGNNVTEEMIQYLKPLIVGEPEVKFLNGLPQYMNVDHLIFD